MCKYKQENVLFKCGKKELICRQHFIVVLFLIKVFKKKSDYMQKSQIPK